MGHAQLHIEREFSQVFLSRTLNDNAIHRLAHCQVGEHFFQWTEVQLLASSAF